jgi:hypothetical protein
VRGVRWRNCVHVLIIIERFVERSKMFNGNVTTIAKALVRPLDATEVSRSVYYYFLFCVLLT